MKPSAVSLPALVLLLLAPPALAQEPPAKTGIPEITISSNPPAEPQKADSNNGDLSELAQAGADAFTRRDWEAAKEAYAQMVAAEPENALALSNLGAVEFQLKNIEGARVHLEKAVWNEPKLAQSWITLGLIYFQQNNLNLAISSLTRAIHEDPADGRAHRYLAVVIRSIGWNNGAESELQRALELNPNDAEAHFNLALMYLERREPAVELARRHYYRAIDLGAQEDALIEQRLTENR